MKEIRKKEEMNSRKLNMKIENILFGLNEANIDNDLYINYLNTEKCVKKLYT